MKNQTDAKAIRSAVEEKYRKVSRSPEGHFKYPTGKEGARKLGYDDVLINAAPHGLTEMFCGVGYPFALGGILPGQAVLDVGCGGGFDLYCAARMAGAAGRVFGIDLSPAMVEKARRNLSAAGIGDALLQVGQSERLPFPGKAFDVVTSNGVLNLSPDKKQAYAEIFRVLKPGGRLQFADMVLKERLPPAEMDAKAWSN